MNREERRKKLFRNLIILLIIAVIALINFLNMVNYDETRHMNMSYAGETDEGWFAFDYENADVQYMSFSYEYNKDGNNVTGEIMRKNVTGSILKYLPFHIAEYLDKDYKDSGQIVVQFTNKSSIIYITILSRMNASIGDQTSGACGTYDKRPLDFLSDFHYVSMIEGNPIILIFQNNDGEEIKIYVSVY